MSDRLSPEIERSEAAKWKRIGQALGPKTPDAAVPPEAPSATDAESGHQCLMLDFRYRTGDSVALSYAYLIAVSFDRSKGIALEFSGYRVTVSGRNLAPVYRAILSHRAAQIQESGEMAAAAAPDAETIVTRIDVREKE